MGFLDTVSNAAKSVGDTFNSATSGIGVQIGKNGLSLSGTLNRAIQKKMQHSNIDSPIKELFQANGGKISDPIVYPEDLDNDHYMIIHVMERKRATLNATPSERAIRSIALPVPMNLATSYGVNYDNKSMGVLGAMAAGNLTGGQLGEGLSSLGDLAGTKIKDTLSAALRQGTTDANQEAKESIAKQQAGATGLAVAGIGAGALLGKLSSNLAAGLGALGAGAAVGAGNIPAGMMFAEGKAINPHMAVMFNDVKFRNFQFQYRLIARNVWESDAIKELIQTLKYHMHPALEDGTLTFGYPEEFDIEFSRTIQPYLFKIKRSVLTDISVNYNGENMPLFFEDTQAPVVIDLTMSFAETKILTKKDFEDSNPLEFAP